MNTSAKRQKEKRKQEIAERFGYADMDTMLKAEYKVKSAKNIGEMIGKSEACVFHWIREAGICKKKPMRKYKNVTNKQILDLIATGKKYREIAVILRCSIYVVNQVAIGNRKKGYEDVVKNDSGRICLDCGGSCGVNIFRCDTCLKRISNSFETARGFENSYCII